MNEKTINTLLIIASGGAAVGGLILILIQIFSETNDNSILCFGLMAVILSNLFNIIRIQRSSKNEK